MRKIISLAILLSPLSVLACGSVSETEQIVRRTSMWIASILFYGSLLTIIGYSILFFFAREDRKKRIIRFSVIISLISLLVILYIYVTNSLLCGSSKF